MDNLKFGKFIKELRKEKNMTQKELAEKLYLTDKAISKWERGLSFPDITILNSISEIFDVSVTEILHGERGEKEKKIDIEKVIQETIESITKKQQKKEQLKRKTKKIVRNYIRNIVYTLYSSASRIYIHY